MKTLTLGLTVALTLATGAFADQVAGKWKTQEGEAGGYLHVDIAPCGASLCGTIAKAYDANGSASSDYEHLGKRLIWDMKADGGGSYSGGKIWAPDADKTYTSKMSLNGNRLEVKGCVAGGLICRGQTWSRVN